MNINIYILLSLLTLTACSGLQHLDKAQENFSKAATLDLSTSSYPSIHYALAYAHLQKSLKQKNTLQKYHLMPSALTLKALCEWKLNEFEKAHVSSKEALLTMNTPSRDKTLMTALPGLILIDETELKRKITFANPNLSYENVLQFFSTYIPGRLGFDILNEAEKTAENEVAIQLYLNQAGFSALKIWSDSLDNLKQKMDTESNFPNEIKELFANQYYLYLQNKGRYFDQLKRLDPDSTMPGYWSKILL
jgi:hypothetical protein